MILTDLLDLANKNKRVKEKIKSIQKITLAIGVVAAVALATGILIAPQSGKETRKIMKNKAVNAFDKIKNIARNNKEMLKNSAAAVDHQISDIISEVHGSTNNLKEDINEGSKKISQDINKTVKNISNEINK